MSTIEIDSHTKAGHERFKKLTKFTVETGNVNKIMTWDEWMNWQATRDPLTDDPTGAEKVRSQIIQEQRGPGISKRRPVKKAAVKQAAAAPPKAEEN